MSYDNWEWLEEGIFQWPRHDRLSPLRIQNLWKQTLQTLPSHTGYSPPSKGAFILNVHLIHIEICIGQIYIKCILIVFILQFKLCGITTLPCDDVIAVLAMVFWLKYVKLCRKRQSDRMKKEINQRRRHQARMRCTLVSRYHCVCYTGLFVCVK